MMTVTGLTLGVQYYIFLVSFGAEGAPVLPSSYTHISPPSITIREIHACSKQTHACITDDTTCTLVGNRMPQQGFELRMHKSCKSSWARYINLLLMYALQI